MKIAIQGIPGSFHHNAANTYFSTDIEFMECLTFDEMPNLLIHKKVDYIVMAIENSIAGAILANYKLIDEYHLHIIGEMYLPIQHQLMALDHQTIEDITEIWSHPMAINQCRAFLRTYPHIKLIEESDTAEVARLIQKKQLKGVAAIASREAAKIYQLTILAQNIQTNSQNYTRFFILKDSKQTIETFNKASLKFITNHEQGSLLEILKIFLNHNLNLSKIQSLPIIDNPWKYSFFTDVVFEDTAQFNRVINDMKSMVSEVKILGKYLKNDYR